MWFKRLFANATHHILVIVLLILSLFFISLSSSNKSNPPKTFLFVVYASVNSAFTSLFSPFCSKDEIVKLNRRNAELMLSNSLLRRYGLENEELKNLLRFKRNSKLNLLSAEIIGRNASPEKSFLIINRGLADSVKKGMTVITDSGLLGIVSECTNNYAKIRTLESGKSNIAVIFEKSGVNGILSWNGRNLLVNNIPSNYDIEVGDRVVTSPISLRFTENIPVGIVTKKVKTVSGLLTNLIVRPYVDFWRVKFAFVVLNSSEKLQQLSEEK